MTPDATRRHSHYLLGTLTSDGLGDVMAYFFLRLAFLAFFAFFLAIDVTSFLDRLTYRHRHECQNFFPLVHKNIRSERAHPARCMYIDQTADRP